MCLSALSPCSICNKLWGNSCGGKCSQNLITDTFLLSTLSTNMVFLPSIRTSSASSKWSNLLTQPFKVTLSMRKQQLSKKLTNFDVTRRFITDQFRQIFSNWVSHMKFNNKKEVSCGWWQSTWYRKVLLLRIIRSPYFMWQLSFFNSCCYSTAHCEWQNE